MLFFSCIQEAEISQIWNKERILKGLHFDSEF